MAEGKKQWTITDYLAVASFVFTLISTGLVIYVASITADVTSAVNDEWQKEELNEVNARMYNLNVRERDGNKELSNEIKELKEKYLKEKTFDDFREDNNRRWNNLEKDMDYLRSLRKFQIPSQPVYRGEEYQPKIQD